MGSEEKEELEITPKFLASVSWWMGCDAYNGVRNEYKGKSRFEEHIELWVVPMASLRNYI